MWALGATLYTAVEGRSPFRRTSPLGTMQAVVDEEPTEAQNAGPLAPVIIPPSTDSSPAAAVVLPPGVPGPRDEISVHGAYPMDSARHDYCIVYSRGC